MTMFMISYMNVKEGKNKNSYAIIILELMSFFFMVLTRVTIIIYYLKDHGWLDTAQKRKLLFIYIKI